MPFMKNLKKDQGRSEYTGLNQGLNWINMVPFSHCDIASSSSSQLQQDFYRNMQANNLSLRLVIKQFLSFLIFRSRYIYNVLLNISFLLLNKCNSKNKAKELSCIYRDIMLCENCFAENCDKYWFRGPLD